MVAIAARSQLQGFASEHVYDYKDLQLFIGLQCIARLANYYKTHKAYDYCRYLQTPLYSATVSLLTMYSHRSNSIGGAYQYDCIKEMANAAPRASSNGFQVSCVYYVDPFLYVGVMRCKTRISMV